MPLPLSVYLSVRLSVTLVQRVQMVEHIKLIYETKRQANNAYKCIRYLIILFDYSF